jgi:hypothetical protein
LWGFDITWPTDKAGNKIDQNIMEMVYGFMSTPKEFKATVTPRSAKRTKIMRDEWEGQFLCITHRIDGQPKRRKASSSSVSSKATEYKPYRFSDVTYIITRYEPLIDALMVDSERSYHFFIARNLSTMAASSQVFLTLSLASIASCHSLTSLIP